MRTPEYEDKPMWGIREVGKVHPAWYWAVAISWTIAALVIILGIRWTNEHGSWDERHRPTTTTSVVEGVGE
ncbi:hypothetical protein I1A62_02920 (plasmid) [Rhodococcus sp. USK10]|uniref:hypothetical protein n=1 Tax=Rhodococcus sp. USK10 TaxID=2789739 RepID=UPI001C5D41EA|nr:hypothetical protein [Rhodococcus sp. USK10]QYB00072.1 hypothetical protein I1A62_02920 [Rhodococcus sp. USK10]